jgi:hypothetical protein
VRQRAWQIPSGRRPAICMHDRWSGQLTRRVDESREEHDLFRAFLHMGVAMGFWRCTWRLKKGLRPPRWAREIGSLQAGLVVHNECHVQESCRLLHMCRRHSTAQDRTGQECWSVGKGPVGLAGAHAAVGEIHVGRCRCRWRACRRAAGADRKLWGRRSHVNYKGRESRDAAEPERAGHVKVEGRRRTV